MGSEQGAHAQFDRLLAVAGWRVQNAKATKIRAARTDHGYRNFGIHE